MRINWTCKDTVITYCKYLNLSANPGNESVVYRKPGQNNYNIGFKSNPHVKPEWIIYSI